MSQSTHCFESVVPLAFGNVYFLSQKRPKSISNKGLSPYCNKKIGILTISSVSPELQHSDCVDWMYSELEIREKSPLSGLPFEVGPPLISYTKTEMHHWWGQLKLKDIIFLICNNKENWKQKKKDEFLYYGFSFCGFGKLFDILLLKRNWKNWMMRGMRTKWNTHHRHYPPPHPHHPHHGC